MQREPFGMSAGASRLSASERPSDSGSRYRLRDLFTPLDTLLASGGDPRLALDRNDRVNAYGCAASPEPELWNFASATASTISQMAYDRAALAREELMHKCLFDEVEIAFDARCEDMREELRGHLALSSRIEIVFSPSGTDSQLHALFVTRAVLGAAPVTIVVGADQTGSGTSHTARGHHFSTMTAGGMAVRKDGAVTGLAGDSIAVPLIDMAAGIAMRTDADAAVLHAVETSLAQGRRVLLQIMDSSKLGWRAPSEACLDEIARRWPRKVQIVVDACQARLGRRRLRAYLDRGYMVLITGSKFFARTGLQRCAAVAERPVAVDRPDVPDRAWHLRLCRSLRLAGGVDDAALALRAPAEFRSMAALGSRAGRDRQLLRRARGLPRQDAGRARSRHRQHDRVVAVASCHSNRHRQVQRRR
ncbi:hypothetical protein ACVWZK_004309 [Bradyrhizobium sp. GM0.4]